MRFIIFMFALLPTLCWSSNNNLSLEITGLNKETQAIVLSNLSIQKNEDDKNLTQDQIFNLYQIGSEEITTTLGSLGYYHAKITQQFSALPKAQYLIRYHIELGAPILISEISIKLVGYAKNQPVLQSIVRQTPLKKGNILKHNQYELFKQELLGKALQLGYLDAAFNINKILLDTHKNQARIFLELDTGKQYFLGDVHFVTPPYPADYLKRYIPFSLGMPYTTERLLALQKNLIDTDLFTKVRLNPDLTEAKHYAIPVNVSLTPKPHNKYTTSLGFGTDSGPRGMIGWERRRKSLPGHRININFRGSKRLNQANAQYTILGKNPGTDRLAFGTQITEEKPSDKKYSLQNESGVTHIQKKGKTEQIVGLHYLSVVFRKLPTDPKSHSDFLLPSIGYAWSTIKKDTLLQQGTRVSFTLRGGLKSVLSSTNVVQAESRLKWIFPVTELSRMLIRANVGAIGSGQFSKIPWNLRFFTGGDHTVRGFGYNSIGPQEQDLNGNFIVVGGKYLAVGSLEFEKKIYKNFGAAIFVDTGNAMNKWRSRLKTGAGFGIRYETPLGPLRLDIARPMLHGKQKPRVHLTFGMDL
jgi:translocation and assembly module TamA